MEGVHGRTKLRTQNPLKGAIPQRGRWCAVVQLLPLHAARPFLLVAWAY
jgi:hypothetical protein